MAVVASDGGEPSAPPELLLPPAPAYGSLPPCGPYSPSYAPPPPPPPGPPAQPAGGAAAAALAAAPSAVPPATLSGALSGGILGDGIEARLRAELLSVRADFLSERTERSALAEQLRAQVSPPLPLTSTLTLTLTLTLALASRDPNP